MLFVVTGFGRCGTSLMMRCLVASGIPAYYDKLLEKSLLAHNKDNYLVNESFMECNPNDYNKLGFTRTVPDGHCIKIALRGVPLLCGGLDYKMILMERNPIAIRTSYIKSGLVPDFDKKYPHWPQFYYDTFGEIEELIKARRDIDYVKVNYHDLATDPKSELRRVANIGVPIKSEAEGEVRPDRYRYMSNA